MSESSTLVTAAHFEYIAKRTATEDAFLASLKKSSRDEAFPPIWISP